MADEIDDAQVVNELHQRIALDAARRAANTVPSHFDGIHCTDCEEPVESPRLALGFHRCLECARTEETRRRTHAR